MHSTHVQERYIQAPELVNYEIKEKETDLLIMTDTDLSDKALRALFKFRGQIEDYIQQDGLFFESMNPHKVPLNAPQITKDMARAAEMVGVGPMAAVAGAIAESIGKELLRSSDNVIVQNGRDIFLKTTDVRRVTVYAGNSPLSRKIAIRIDPTDSPLGICSSSGTDGHGLSLGKADVVIVLARSAALADAASTAIANLVQDAQTMREGLKFAESTKKLFGVLIIKDDQMGVRGKINIEAIF